MSGYAKYNLFGIVPHCWAVDFILFYFCYYINHSQNPKVPLYQRQSLPQTFSHALKMHVFSNTNPQFPKTS